MELCPSDPSLALGGPSKGQGTPRKRVNPDDSRQENQDEFTAEADSMEDDPLAEFEAWLTSGAVELMEE